MPITHLSYRQLHANGQMLTNTNAYKTPYDDDMTEKAHTNVHIRRM